MLNHHCRRNPELHEELQIQAAVAAGDVYTVRRMLEQGYSPKIRDANGWTLLHFSAAKGKERCVRVFLEHGGQFLCPVFAENVFRLRSVLCQTLEGVIVLKQNLFVQVLISYNPPSRAVTFRNFWKIICQKNNCN